MSYLKMEKQDLDNQRVIIRADLNVPMEAGKIQSDARIREFIPTLQLALNKGAKILVLSHLGRPEEGKYDKTFSLQPIKNRISEILHKEIGFSENWLNGIDLKKSEIILGENVRFNIGEEKNDPGLAKKMAELCDVFVMDAFGAAHRKHASTYGIAEYAKMAVAGPLICKEVDTLNQILTNPKRPLVAIVGGAKVSTKCKVIESLMKKVDVLILGGGIANTFCYAKGINIGQSLYEPAFVEKAKALLDQAKELNVTVLLPEDVVVAKELNNTNKLNEMNSIDISQIKSDDKIFDVGKKTSLIYADVIQKAQMILWNGPLGVFEIDAFSLGTKNLAETIASANAFSVAGGGETIAAIEKFGVMSQISYISTGGGAFLEYLEAGTLPGIEILKERGKRGLGK